MKRGDVKIDTLPLYLSQNNKNWTSREFETNSLNISDQSAALTVSGLDIEILCGFSLTIFAPSRRGVLGEYETTGKCQYSEIFSYKLDDNLTIPILAGLVGQIAKIFFH